MATTVNELELRLNLNSKQFESQASKITADMEKMKNNAAKTGSSVTDMMKGFVGGFGAVEIIKGIASAVTSLGSSMIQGNAKMETYRTSFGVMLGGIENANKMMAQLVKFGAETPFELPELADSTKKLLAFGVAQEDILPSLKKIGDIASGVGVPIGELSEIYGKAKVQGKLMSEDINQLLGRGVPVIQEFAKQLGVSDAQVKKMASEGKINFEMLSKAFDSLTSNGGRFSGMMDAQSKTFDGLSSTMSDNLNQIAIDIGEPLFTAAKSGLIGVISWLSGPEAKEIFDFVKTSLNSVIGLFDSDAEAVERNNNQMLELNKEMQSFTQTQIDQTNNVKSMATEYESLATKTNRTKEENKKLHKLYTNLQVQYPNYIKATGDYAGSLDAVKLAAGEADKTLGALKGQMDALQKEQIKFTQLNIENMKFLLKEQIMDMSTISESSLTIGQRAGENLIEGFVLYTTGNAFGEFETASEKLKKSWEKAFADVVSGGDKSDKALNFVKAELEKAYKGKNIELVQALQEKLSLVMKYRNQIAQEAELKAQAEKDILAGPKNEPAKQIEKEEETKKKQTALQIAKDFIEKQDNLRKLGKISDEQYYLSLKEYSTKIKGEGDIQDKARVAILESMEKYVKENDKIRTAAEESLKLQKEARASLLEWWKKGQEDATKSADETLVGSQKNPIAKANMQEELLHAQNINNLEKFKNDKVIYNLMLENEEKRHADVMSDIREDELKKHDQYVNLTLDTLSILGQGMGSALSAENSEDAGKAMNEMYKTLINSALTFVETEWLLAEAMTFIRALFTSGASLTWDGALAVAGFAAIEVARAAVSAMKFATGTDTVPAMLTPGEMIVPRTFNDAIKQGKISIGGPNGTSTKNNKMTLDLSISQFDNVQRSSDYRIKQMSL